MGIHTLKKNEESTISHRPYWTRLEEVRPINAKFTPTYRGRDIVGGTVEYTDYDGVPIYPIYMYTHDMEVKEMGRHPKFDKDKLLPHGYNLVGYMYSQVYKKHVEIITSFSY